MKHPRFPLLTVALAACLWFDPVPGRAQDVAQDAQADTRGDGVPDRADACPDTPPGIRVDSHGCTCETSTELRFAPGAARLTGDHKVKLDWVAGQLRRVDWARIAVEGYTDATGSADYNRKLAARRVAAVRAYLVAEGIEPGRLVARNRGAQRTGDATRTRRVVLRRIDCDG